MKMLSSGAKRVAIAAAAAVAIATPAFALAARPDIVFDPVPVSVTGKMVTITQDGTVLVRGAKVTDVSNDRVTAQMSWGDLTLTWRLDTDSGTQYLRANDSAAARGDLEKGDTVSFNGSLDTNASAFAVNADVIRDWSLGSTASTTSTDWKPHPYMSFWTGLESRLNFLPFFAHAKVDAKAETDR